MNYIYLSFIFMLILMNIILFTNNFIFSNPMNLNFFLIIYTILMSFNLTKTQNFYIYSMMMFLIMIGGILILFLYFTSICPNEPFKFKLNSFILTNNYIIFWILFINFNKLYMTNSIQNQSPYFLFNNFLSNIQKIYSYPISVVTLKILFFMIFTLLIIMKLINFNKSIKTLKSFY